jgi:hypothetical protein
MDWKTLLILAVLLLIICLLFRAPLYRLLDRATGVKFNLWDKAQFEVTTSIPTRAPVLSGFTFQVQTVVRPPITDRSAAARSLLYTLYTHELAHRGADIGANDTWTMAAAPHSPNYNTFQAGLSELYPLHLVDLADNGYVGLTAEGRALAAGIQAGDGVHDLWV